MGKRDLTLKDYLSDPVRYADIYNGSVFGGAQVLDASQLEEAGTVATKASGGVSLETTCDIAMRQRAGGGLFTLWILENQEKVDYVKTHEECRHLDVETYGVIGKLINSAKLQEAQEKTEESEGEQDMNDVIGELVEDGRAEGSASQMIAIIGSMMEKLHCTLEEACEIAGKTVEEYRQARELV